MEKIKRTFWLSIFIMICLVNLPANVPAEFYKYVDKEGRVHFVDEFFKKCGLHHRLSKRGDSLETAGRGGFGQLRRKDFG